MRHEDPVSASDVRRAGMDLLARREHGREELASKLKRRFARREMQHGLIAEALDALESDGLLSDVRYAESLLRQLLGKGLGPLKLRAELNQRGLSADAMMHIQPDIDAVDWFAAAERVFERKFGSTSVVVQDFEMLRKEQARRARFMQYRGFLPEHFQHLLASLQIPEPLDE